MTTNAFIFAWDQLGIEAIVPITKYEGWDEQNTWNILKGEKPERNPLNGIIQQLTLRAMFNPQRHYEIYAIDCDESLDEEFWRKQWEEHPQATADLIREKGHKFYSDRADKKRVVIE